jgi:DNA segregation ATPase FtsK/SpoIIIE, S-DNA-T family
VALAVVMSPVSVVVHLPVLVAGVIALARLGRPIDRPILERTIIKPAYRRLTAALTRQVIMATSLVKRPEDIVFCSGDIRARSDQPTTHGNPLAARSRLGA